MSKNLKGIIISVCFFITSYCSVITFADTKQNVTFYFIDKDSVLEIIPGYQKAIKSIQSYQEEEQKKLWNIKKKLKS